MKTYRLSNYYWRLGLVSFLTVGGAIASSFDRATAQVTPDNTLGAESSVVTPNVDINGTPSDRIDGGAIRGANLFHSFGEFNINEGRGAYFTNPSGITNILSRVTGNNPSNILGKLGVLGNADLFLINPHGIIFGPNASLDLGGSFVGSTASSLNFADGTEFSATNPQSLPLLKVSVPTGLQFGSNVGRILVQGNGQGIRITTDLVDSTSGLRVLPNRTLALLGGDITLEGGTLKTAGGRIELGSVTGTGLVSLHPIEKGWAFGYSGVTTFGDIQLLSTAAVDASGAGSGDIQVQSGWVALRDGSVIEASTLRAESGGTLTLKASESVELSGNSGNALFPTGLFTLVYPGATGVGGNLTLETPQLIVRDGATAFAGTFGAGPAGTLTVKASESVELMGTSADNRVRSSLSTSTELGVTGAGGNITLETRRLTVRDGAQIGAGTFGSGPAGTLMVKASESVELIGTSASGGSSSLFTSSQPEATGGGGNITLETRRLTVRDGAQIGAGTFGTGPAGTLTVKASESVELLGEDPIEGNPSALFTTVINPEAKDTGGNLVLETPRLIVRDGAVVSAATFGAGAGGTLTVTAPESIELSGISAVTGEPGGLVTTANSTGDAGDVVIKTGQLIVRDGAQVSVGSQGSGIAGNLEVAARTISLDNQGKLNAETASGNGGNITLQVQDLLSMRRNSQISATAGTAQAGGDGGNINIGAGLIVALENSDITANAFEGRGGNVQIGTQGLFLSPDSQITASSERGIDGAVEIRTPDVELENSLTQLAANFASPDRVVAGSCLARRNVERGSFTVTGTGGLPSSPYEAISSRYEVSNIQPIGANNRVSKPAAIVATAPWKRGEPIREAQGMTVTTDGRTVIGTTSQIASIAKTQNLICPSE